MRIYSSLLFRTTMCFIALELKLGKKTVKGGGLPFSFVLDEMRA